MSPAEMTMYCTICGGPMFEKGIYANTPDWLTFATLLYLDNQGGKIPNNTGSAVVSVPATNNGGPYFTIDKGTTLPEKVTASNIDVISPFFRVRPILYLPLHKCCFDIVRDVATTSEYDFSCDEWLFRVWKVLYVRWRLVCKDRMIPPTSIWEFHGWYGACRYHGMEWEPLDSGIESKVSSDGQHQYVLMVADKYSGHEIVPDS